MTLSAYVSVLVTICLSTPTLYCKSFIFYVKNSPTFIPQGQVRGSNQEKYPYVAFFCYTWSLQSVDYYKCPNSILNELTTYEVINISISRHIIHTRKNAFHDYRSSMKFLAVFKSQLHGTIRFGPLILTESGETMDSKNKYFKHLCVI